MVLLGGISQYIEDIQTADKTIAYCKDFGFNSIRYSNNQFSSSFPFKREIADRILATSNLNLIIDMTHEYPPDATTAAFIRAHMAEIRQNIRNIAGMYKNNFRVAHEILNEYVDSDLYTIAQPMVDDVRAICDNAIIINKWSQPWQKIADKKNNTYQSYHYYFGGDVVGSGWTPSGALADLDKAKAAGITNICNTEIGANWMEYPHFTADNVARLNQFMDASVKRGYGFAIWNNGSTPTSDNMPTYKQLNLTVPPLPAPTPLTPYPYAVAGVMALALIGYLVVRGK